MATAVGHGVSHSGIQGVSSGCHLAVAVEVTSGCYLAVAVGIVVCVRGVGLPKVAH